MRVKAVKVMTIGTADPPRPAIHVPTRHRSYQVRRPADPTRCAALTTSLAREPMENPRPLLHTWKSCRSALTRSLKKCNGRV